MRIPLCDLRPSIARDRERLLSAMAEVVDQAAFVLGAHVERFESRLAAYLGRAHAVGVASCSDALELSLRALDVGPGKAVITTPFTFVATAESIANAGARPLFAEVSPDSLLLDLAAVDRALARLPRAPSGRRLLPSGDEVAALMPVHLFGAAHDADELRGVSMRHQLVVIEDTAQALGASSGGAKAGSMGEAACFSFFPTKTLGGFGDGGAVATDDEALAGRLRLLRQHGSEGKARGGLSVERGRNSRLDALQAAVLSVRLERLDDDVGERRRLVERYAERLAPLSPALEPLWPRLPRGHAAQQMVVRARGRDALAARLAESGIGTAVYYGRPLHALAPYESAPRLTPLDHAERACLEVLALPLYVGLADHQVDEVCSAIEAALR